MAEDPAFHFPPDVFEAVVGAVPLLVRAKRDVLLFFQGCGLDPSYLATIEPWTRKDSGKSKFHIAREAVRYLNELGDRGIGIRRRLLQRVTEFENFTACWPDDQLKAKGAVAELRDLIKTKDSFTRLQQEHERTETKHREDRRAQVERDAAKRAEREGVKADLYRLFGESDARRRGKALEGVLNRLFVVNDISLREAFAITGDAGEGVIEQIDGAVRIDGKHYLVEMKWWTEPLGKAEVASHLVNVYGRGDVGGIFISNSGYHDSAVAVHKEALSKAIVILVELEELVTLFEQDRPLLDRTLLAGRRAR